MSAVRDQLAPPSSERSIKHRHSPFSSDAGASSAPSGSASILLRTGPLPPTSPGTNSSGSDQLRPQSADRIAFIALVKYEDGELRYILAPLGLKAGDTVVSSASADIKPGNCLPLANIPVGTIIHNIEINPGRGAQLVRSAGDYAQLMAKDAQYVQVRLPSGEVRLVRPNCIAVIGQVGNIDHENVHIGKAGRTRHMGIRPTVRGSVMNPNDHPHGGGEGKSPVGHPGPMTPWGKPAMGLKTRKTKNRTNKYIFKHRNAK